MNKNYRRDRSRAISAGLAAIIAFAVLLSAASALAADGYAIIDVTVVPMDRETTMPGQTVLVEKGRITSIGPAGQTAVPDGFDRIDGQGRFLAPGLADMHAHPMTEQDLDLQLAAGVTLIRAMWGEPAVLRMRDEIAKGERTGPRIVAGGRIVDGEPVIHYGTDQVLTRADAERVVRTQHAAGYDFIKVYSNLSVEAFDAIAAVAKEVGIPFAGHVPAAVPMGHALQSGMQTSEHLLGIANATLAEGAIEVWRFGPEFAPFAERIGSGALALEDHYDDRKLTELAHLAAKTGHWTVPTLAVLRGISLDPAAKDREWQRREMTYTDFTVKAFWKQFTSAAPPQSDDYYRGVERLFGNSLHQVKVFHDAGVRLLAGTDAPNPFVYVGFSLVEELELFVQAGLSPYESLKTATVNVAELVGEVGTAGTVTVGARADLALLESNPLNDVGAYRSLSGLSVNGRWLDRADLDRRLAGVVANNERKAAPFAEAPAWPLAEDEAVPIYAGFTLQAAGAGAGTERIARAQAGDAVRAIVAERRSADGGITAWRVEADDKGRAIRLSVTEGTGGAATTIARQDGGFEIRRADGSTARIEATSDRILTGTGADALSLRDQFDAMVDGDTLQLEALCLLPENLLEACTVKITRNPSEVIEGHFYFSGVNRYDLEVETAAGTRTSRIWMGGGFYTGWPVRLELDTSSAAAPLHYRRIL